MHKQIDNVVERLRVALVARSTLAGDCLLQLAKDHIVTQREAGHLGLVVRYWMSLGKVSTLKQNLEHANQGNHKSLTGIFVEVVTWIHVGIHIGTVNFAVVSTVFALAHL